MRAGISTRDQATAADNVAMARFVTHLVNRQSSPLNTSSLHPASEGPRSWFIHRKEELDPDFLEDHVTRCPEGDCVARMGRANAVTATFSGFMRSGRSSDVRIRASGSRRQQRWRLLWPRSHQYAIEGHRRSRVCIDRSPPRPWPEDCSH